MFKLNFKITLRNLWKNKVASLINIGGLAIGLTSCLLLLLYVSYEWNFDKQGKDAAQIYQVLTNFEGLNGEIEDTGFQTGNAIGPVLQQNYPGVLAMSRINENGMQLIANKEQAFKKQAYFADKGILKIFDYTFIYGDRNTALDAPDNIILTESMAKLLFGTTNVLNRPVRYMDKMDFKVTGVIKDLPGNMSNRFDYLMPWSAYEKYDEWAKMLGWSNNNWVTLLKLDPSVNIAQFNNSIKGLIKKNEKETLASPFIFPFSKLHLYDDFENGISTGGSIEQLRLFMGLAIGILLIACINFMNMATARSEKRAREVGIKKTIGATRGSLISQFLLESLVLTVCSTLLAIVLIEFCLPLFNNLLGTQLSITYSNPVLWIGLLSVVLLTGLIAGSYPAFYLSSFNPVQIFRKKNKHSGKWSVNLRQLLVVGQFSFAVILIISTTVIYRQIQFAKNRPVGYQLSELVEMTEDGISNEKFELLKDKLIQSGAVNAVFQSSGSMSRATSNFWGLEWPGMSPAGKQFVFNQMATTYGFIKTTGVKLIEGRDFSRVFASDTAAVLLSKAAVKQMNLTNPVGQVVKYKDQNCTVIGVFEDFIWGSPYRANRPMVVAFNKHWNGTITMRLNHANSVAVNMGKIAIIAKEVNPAYPVEINFVDQLYADKLKNQKTLGILANLFGGLAIFISCLGLFALAAYSAEQRTKEIGVRKVLGASVSNLIQLLSLSFLKMVMISIVISVPVANYIMNKWLKGFEFHTEISWLVVMLVAVGTFVIALLTVSFQTYRAAKANPVDALKYE